MNRWWARLVAPQPIVRLELVRILAPLAILLFMASRIAHADAWLSTDGFHAPILDDDWRQPATFPPVAPGIAWTIALALLTTGLAVSLGLFTRITTIVFAATLAYVTLADRFEAFTVSKLGTVIAVALALTPCGTRSSLDARRANRPDPPELCSWGAVRFFQLLIPIFYFASGLAKARGEWLSDPCVLWSHIHDSYQTSVSYFLGAHLPAWSWTVMQATTLAFELGAPLWFALPWTRRYALGYGIAMHALIGMMFGPVAWFALLMISLLVACYAPVGWLQPSFGLRS